MDNATRAQEAASLLENEVLTEALASIERDAIERMIHGIDDNARLVFSLEVKAVRDLRTKLVMYKSDVPRPKAARV